MATKHDEFKVYYFSFTDEELVTILWALRCHGDVGLADWIAEQVYDDEPESVGTAASLKFDIDFSAVDDATEALDRLACAAVEAERAVNSLSKATGGDVGNGAW